MWNLMLNLKFRPLTVTLVVVCALSVELLFGCHEKLVNVRHPRSRTSVSGVVVGGACCRLRCHGDCVRLYVPCIAAMMRPPGAMPGQQD